MLLKKNLKHEFLSEWRMCKTLYNAWKSEPKAPPPCSHCWGAEFEGTDAPKSQRRGEVTPLKPLHPSSFVFPLGTTVTRAGGSWKCATHSLPLRIRKEDFELSAQRYSSRTSLAESRWPATQAQSIMWVIHGIECVSWWWIISHGCYSRSFIPPETGPPHHSMWNPWVSVGYAPITTVDP